MSAFAQSLYIPGIQPHPTLPIFVTYGIDSTAKLWRATSPVDMDVDDSDLGRYNYHSKQVRYQKSIVVDQWKKVRKGKEASKFSHFQNIVLLPARLIYLNYPSIPSRWISRTKI